MSRSLWPLLLSLLLLLSSFAADAAPHRHHSSLDPLTRNDASLSSRGRAAHAQRFAQHLASYASHLSNSADVMLLQAASVARHAALHRTHSEVDAGADMQMQSLGSGAAATELDALFAAGDAWGVVSLLERTRDLHLSSAARAHLAQGVEDRMAALVVAIAAGENVPQKEVHQSIDALVTETLAAQQAARQAAPVRAHSLIHTGGMAWGEPTADAAAAAGVDASAAGGEMTLDVSAQESALASAESADTLAATVQSAMESANAAAEKALDNDPDAPAPSAPVNSTALVSVTPESLAGLLSEALTVISSGAIDPAQALPIEISEEAPKLPPAADVESLAAAIFKNISSGANVTIPAAPVSAVNSSASPDALDAAASSTDPAVASSLSLGTEVANTTLTPETALAVFNAQLGAWDDLVRHERDVCTRHKSNGDTCDMEETLKKLGVQLSRMLHGELPELMETPPDSSLPLSSSLDITRGNTSTPESVQDVEASVRAGVDPWWNLPGRAPKAIHVKSRRVVDLLDAEAERCPKRCSGHGQCVLDTNSTVRSASGLQNVHPFKCLCDAGYVGESCQMKLDMYLRWLLTEGAAPLPKCCNVCDAQREVPTKWDEIPTFQNPFTTIAPQCQPRPRLSLYSRDSGALEADNRRRRADPRCSSPLSDLADVDPLVALELAADLSEAQAILHGGLLEDMQRLSDRHETLHQMQPQQRSAHVDRLQSAASTLRQASQTAERAARALAAKLHIPNLVDVKHGSVDMGALFSAARDLPNDMDECCLVCEPEPVVDPLPKSTLPGAQYGEDAILSTDPRNDSPVEERYRRFAQRRKDRRHARLLGTTPRAEQDCCVLCPYSFREVERLQEIMAAQEQRKADAQAAADALNAASAADEQPIVQVVSGPSAASTSEPSGPTGELDAMFLEAFAEIDGDRRRRNAPMPCCDACPSQFLVAHAFPTGPFANRRTNPFQP